MILFFLVLPSIECLVPEKMPTHPLWVGPSLVLSDGTVEVLKWLGLVAMSIDHLNAFWWHHAWPPGYAIGRLAFPIFVVVLAYNLARPANDTPERYRRILWRLGIAGLVAEPFHHMLTGAHELNVLFSLALLTVMVGGLRGGPLQRAGARVLALVGGVAVEYLWVAPLLGLAVWRYTRQPSGWAVVLSLVAMTLLSVLNGNYWSWLVGPLLLVAAHRPLPRTLPRGRNLFYVFYPAHLALLWVFS